MSAFMYRVLQKHIKINLYQFIPNSATANPTYTKIQNCLRIDGMKIFTHLGL